MQTRISEHKVTCKQSVDTGYCADRSASVLADVKCSLADGVVSLYVCFTAAGMQIPLCASNSGHLVLILADFICTVTSLRVRVDRIHTPFIFPLFFHRVSY